MPAFRSSFARFVVPSLVITAVLTGGLEAMARQAGETLRECGRSYAPCRMDSLLVQSEPTTSRVGAAPAAGQHAASHADASA